MQLTLTRPDDWHLHLRDGAALTMTVPDSARAFYRAIVMPNLKPPVATVDAAIEYRQRILTALPTGMTFDPLMTLYLTPDLSPAIIREAASSEHVYGVKLYPQGATTNSDAGVASLDGLLPTLEAMAETGFPLLVHGEVTDRSIDIFDREAVFLDRTLDPLMQRLPHLKVVLEHITTKDSVDFVKAHPDMGATITAHHLMYERNDMLAGGIRPHLYCLPILKRSLHRNALIEAATSGVSQFFLGTDSAPHAIGDKESDCGCAGCYTAPIALELYAEVFEAQGKLDRLETFASFNGAEFYGLPRNTETITLTKTESSVPITRSFGDTEVRLIRGGETVSWSLT
ncbi:MAG: dihydroorotase [Pseudomonadota bacterium]|nr:dihydroorotase [Pseudomonadota bacterium]MEC9076740.1 dihydroorotase [Pseudomonadota bacterium]MEE2820690.1 dihydroorotase [Pseudomonadota bacterium]